MSGDDACRSWTSLNFPSPLKFVVESCEGAVLNSGRSETMPVAMLFIVAFASRSEYFFLFVGDSGYRVAVRLTSLLAVLLQILPKVFWYVDHCRCILEAAACEDADKFECVDRFGLFMFSNKV